MTVKEIIDILGYGVDYQLIGAHSGKILAKSWKNKNTFVKKYYECRGSTIYPDFRKSNVGLTSCIPIICIWVLGE